MVLSALGTEIPRQSRRCHSTACHRERRRIDRRRLRRNVAQMRNFLIVLLALVAGCESGPKIPYVPRDAALRTEPLLFYPARDRPARAFVLFLGNDVGFWKPHEELAWRLAENGYDVVGLDVKKYLAQLPEDEPARDSSFDASIGPLIARARRELGADSLPVVVGGHSFGAEVAFWIAL